MKLASFISCKRLVTILAALALAFSTASMAWSADPQPLNPQADTYIWQSSGGAQPPINKNYGDADFLYVGAHYNTGQSDPRNKRTLLRFDLNGLTVPEGCTISGATLELYMTKAPGQPRTYDLYFVDDDTWGETVVTWNTQPPYGAKLDSVGTASAVENILKWGAGGPNPLTENLTGKVQYEYGSGNKVISLLIRDDSEGSTTNTNPGNHEAEFVSKDYGLTPALTIPVLRVEFTCEGTEKQGCSHGFWKNHLAYWPPTGYAPNDTLFPHFTGLPTALQSDTFEMALSYGGGKGVTGGAKILLRNAVASLLNAAHPDVNYEYSVAEVKALVNAALSSNDREAMLTLEKELDVYNNIGCPLGE